MKKIIINYLKKIVNKYEDKHETTNRPIFICDHIDTRNRNKLPEWQIPEDKPQCPIFSDNRCCGGCHLAPSCDHAIDCNCFGYTYAVLGGDDEHNYMRRCSDYSMYGRIVDGKFDWSFYSLNKKKARLKLGKHIQIFFTDSTKSKLEISEEDFAFLWDNEMRNGIIESKISDNGQVSVKFYNEDSTMEKVLKVNFAGL